jgi:hypothetical protein
MQAMPLPSANLAGLTGGMSEEDAIASAVAASTAEAQDEGIDVEENAAKSPPRAGVSFAKIAALGFAATGERPHLCTLPVGQEWLHKSQGASCQQAS